MWTPAHAYLHTNSFVHTENVFRSALQNAGKRSDLSATASSGTPALSLNSLGLRWPRFPTTMLSFFLDQSTQHFDIGPYKTTFRKHRSNIGSHIYVACLRLSTATFVLFPLYPSRPIEFASCRPPKLRTFHSPFYLSFGCSQFKNFYVPDYRDNQCDLSLLHAIRTIWVFV